MVRQHRFAQLYGYAVCLVCVVVALISGRSLVDDAFDRARPGYSEWGREVPPSFEEFRAEHRGQLIPGGRPMVPTSGGPDTAAATAPLTDEQLRRIYESRRSEVHERAVFRATKSLVGNALLFLASVLLFVGHWRWLRGIRDDAVGIP